MWGYAPEIESEGNLSRLFTTTRLPTLTGARRVAVIEDAHLLSKREWTMVEAEVKARQIPVVLIVEDPTQIPWAIRKGTLRIDLSRPTQKQLVDWLQGIRDEHNLTHSDSDLATIATQSSTWRSARLTLMTTPPGVDPEQILASVGRFGVGPKNPSEITEILAGRHRGPTTNFHPLAILSMAEYNGADPHHIATGLVLHAHDWKTDGLSPIVKDYLTTLRASSQNRVPYRNRPLWGSPQLI